MAIPVQDTALVSYSTNMNTRLVASGVSIYDVSAPDVTAFTAAYEAYIAAYNTMIDAREAGTRSEAMTAATAAAKLALLDVARPIYSTVQANPSISDADKILLGVKVRAAASSIARPSVAPGMHIDGVSGRTVDVTLHDDTVTPHRSKPPGSVAAWIYSFVGNDYPSNPAAWSFQGACTGRRAQIQFDDTVPAGAKVFFTAAWINAKHEAGPTCIPLSTNLQGGGSEEEVA